MSNDQLAFVRKHDHWSLGLGHCSFSLVARLLNFLLESPFAVGALGLLAVTMAAIPYVQTKKPAALVALAVAMLLAVGGVAFERLYQTPREQLTSELAGLFSAIEADDLQGVLSHIDPRETAGVRADAETLMPMFRVESASEGGEVDVELPADASADGAVATARLKPLIRVQHVSSGTVGAYFDGLEMDFVRRDGRWLVQAYRPAKDWREGASSIGR